MQPVLCEFASWADLICKGGGLGVITGKRSQRAELEDGLIMPEKIAAVRCFSMQEGSQWDTMRKAIPASLGCQESLGALEG